MIRISVKKNVFVCLVIAIIIILSLYQYCDNNAETCFYLKQDIPHISGNYLQLNTSKVPSGHVRWLPTDRVTTPTIDTLQKLLGRDGRKNKKQSGRESSSDSELNRVERVDMEEVAIEQKQRELAKVYGLDHDHDNKSLGYRKEEFAKFEEIYHRDEKRSAWNKSHHRNYLIGENKTVVRFERVDKTILDPGSISKHELQEYSDKTRNRSSTFMYVLMTKTDLTDKYETVNETRGDVSVMNLSSAANMNKTTNIFGSMNSNDAKNRKTDSKQENVVNSDIEDWRSVVKSNDASKSTKLNSIFALADGHYANNSSTASQHWQLTASERMTKARYANRANASLTKGHSLPYQHSREKFDHKKNDTRNSNIEIDSKGNYGKVDTLRTGKKDSIPGDSQLQNKKLESTKMVNDSWNDRFVLGGTESESGENEEVESQDQGTALLNSNHQADTDRNSNVEDSSLENSQASSGDDGGEINSDEEIASRNSINKVSNELETQNRETVKERYRQQNQNEFTDEVDENVDDTLQSSGNILQGNEMISQNVTTELKDVDNFEEGEANTIENKKWTKKVGMSLNRSTEEALQTQGNVTSNKRTLFATKTRSNGTNENNRASVNTTMITKSKVEYKHETKWPNDAAFNENETTEKNWNNRTVINLKPSKNDSKHLMMGRHSDSRMTMGEKIMTRRSYPSLKNQKGDDFWDKHRKAKRKSKLLYFKNVTCESLDPKLVLYNRIFKTGSSSLNQYLLEEWRKHYFAVKIGTTEDWYKTGDSHPYPEVIEEFASRSSRRRVYSGHFYFRDNLKVERPYTYINQVRDPVERIISHYFYMRSSSDRPKQRIAEMRKNGELNETLVECLERQHRGCESNMMTRFFCGNAEFCKTGSQEAIERAKSNMLHRFAAIGLVEQLDLYLKILKKRLPHFFRIKRSLSHVKANNEKGYLKKVPPDVKVKLSLANFADNEIYEYAKDIFWKQVKACSLDVEQNGLYKEGVKGRYKESNIVHKS